MTTIPTPISNEMRKEAELVIRLPECCWFCSPKTHERLSPSIDLCLTFHSVDDVEDGEILYDKHRDLPCFPGDYLLSFRTYSSMPTTSHGGLFAFCGAKTS